MQNDVFICHSAKDKSVAIAICNELEMADFKCWIAPRNVIGGKQYAREIVAAIKSSHTVLFIFSQDSNTSSHVENEIDTAFNEGKVIIPFKIDHTEVNEFLKYYLQKRHWIEKAESMDKSIQDIINMLNANIPNRAKNSGLTDAYKTIKQVVSKDAVDYNEQNPEEYLIELSIKMGIENILKKKSQTKAGKSGREYRLLQNALGEILMITDESSGEPDPGTAKIMYDGGSFALFEKNNDVGFVMRDITKEASEAMMSLKEVYVIEMREEELIREYKIPLKIVNNLQTLFAQAQNDLGIKSPESKVVKITNLEDLYEALAKRVHDVWSAGRFADGWRYGEVRDDVNKKHPGIVPYEQLSQEEKSYDRRTSQATIEFILAQGFEITKKEF